MKKHILLFTVLLLSYATYGMALQCGNTAYIEDSGADGDFSIDISQNYGDGIQEQQDPNHKHAVGMHSVRWQVLTQSDDWIEGIPFRARLGTTQEMNIRVKAEEKEGWHQDNVCIDLYYSHDRYFSRSHDTLLETKCIGALAPNENKSAYFDNYALDELDAQTHYLFADIRYGIDHNISSNSDDTEYVKIEVIDPEDAPPIDLLVHSLALTHPAYVGEIMGLRVAIANVGTTDAYSGTRGVYQIRTSAGWQTIADDGTDAEQLAVGLTAWEEISDAHGLRAPTIPGSYEYRFCADDPNYLIETDETNNCTSAILEILPQRFPDLITRDLALTEGKMWLYSGDRYGLQVNIINVGAVAPSGSIRTSYDIKGPGTNNVWQRVADDGSDAGELAPGRTQFEYISDEHGASIPATPGTYTARACADHQNSIKEADETNNCTTVQFAVKAKPGPNLVPTYVGIQGGLSVNSIYSFKPEFRVTNAGTANATSGIRSSYFIAGPGTNNAWQYIDGDGSDQSQLYAGGSAFERIDKGAYVPNRKSGQYQLRVCVDVYNAVTESDEADNCRVVTFYAH